MKKHTIMVNGHRYVSSAYDSLGDVVMDIFVYLTEEELEKVARKWAASIADIEIVMFEWMDQHRSGANDLFDILREVLTSRRRKEILERSNISEYSADLPQQFLHKP